MTNELGVGLRDSAGCGRYEDEWRVGEDNGVLARQFPSIYSLRCGPLFRSRGTRNLNAFFRPLLDFDDESMWMARVIRRGEL